MKEHNIEHIITKVLLGEASPDEHMLVNNWRNESDENEALFQEYSTVWNSAAGYTPKDFYPNKERAYQKHIESLTNVSNVISLQKETQEQVENKVSTSKRKIYSLNRIASIAALFIVVFGAMFVFNLMNTTTITAENGVYFASLEDGSNIWLEEGSTLSYDRGFGEYHRDVVLEGKAFFDVQRNTALGFNIKANDLNVSVLGTSFTVDSKSTTPSVAVKTGKVAVTSNAEKITLLPNEKAVLQKNKLQAAEIEPADLNWRNPGLSFKNASLEQVVADINMYHDDRLMLISDLGQMECPFTSQSLHDATFTDIINVLRATYDLDVEEDEKSGKVKLIISECK